MTGQTLEKGQAELPTPNPTKSFWHRDPSRLLLGHRTTKHLPHEADVVVIGSGITGAFAARGLCRDGAKRRVVMLESREACWGATGRNGGHCQPRLYDKSIPVARFELGTFDYIHQLIARHDIACDWKVVGGVHPMKTPELLNAIKARVQRIAARDPDLAAQIQVVEDPDELKQLRVEGAVGAVFQPNAAKCWPYKLVAWILEGLVQGGAGDKEEAGERLFNLQTNTSATGLQKLDDGQWIVHTPRGQIAADHVLLATNAYTSHLLPRMAGVIVPVRGQVSALARPEDGVQLRHSYGWVDGESGDDYLIHRDAGGPLIFGGGRLVAEGAEVGISSDDAVNADVARHLRRAMFGRLKLKKGSGEEEEEELEAGLEWTGIMGYSKDARPWVGPVPESLGGGPGLWMSAGYTGHGMPVGARTGVAVAQMIMGTDGEDGAVEVPEEYWITESRIEELKSRVERTLVEELEMLDRL
ncbi:hypothetical protein NLU13_0031 [Sarocladium strictum]|uniref:FAD dependent oxidoreductase domain-containing protein n=1 Tax=Sarocladium strictum TaxID=5046 RepID=A0AA39LAW7_SARSR|nr:hypothetical protein NLU13_0031 [Sarocladium strictum]